jgi:hypothetical protein
MGRERSVRRARAVGIPAEYGAPTSGSRLQGRSPVPGVAEGSLANVVMA